MMVLIEGSLRYFSRETRTIEETRVPRDSCLAFFAHALYERANTLLQNLQPGCKHLLLSLLSSSRRFASVRR